MDQPRTQPCPGNSDRVDRREYDVFTRRELILLLVLSIVAAVVLDLVFYPGTLEDAYITFRYSEHLSEGHGFGAWNITGERVEGYTTFAWMLILGLADRVGIDVRTTSKVLGLLSHLTMVSLLIAFPLLPKRLSRNSRDLMANPNDGVLAGVFLALYMPLCYYATSGMETVLFSTLTALLFLSLSLRWSVLLVPVIAALLVLTRPEGLLIAAVGIACGWLKRRQGGTPIIRPLISTGILLGTVGALLLHRFAVFGEVLPNTYWAKAGGAGLQHMTWGIRYLLAWTRPHSLVIFLVLLAAVFVMLTLRRESMRIWPIVSGGMLLLLTIFVIYVVKVGGDNYSAFPYWRHLVHLSPVIALLLSYSITRLHPHARHYQLAVLLAVALATNGFLLGVDGGKLATALRDSLNSYPALTHSPHNFYYTWLAQHAQDDTTVASSLGGELPYVMDAVHIDTLGLNTRYIAKNGSFDPDGPQDSKTDMEWVLAQRPDIIEGYVSAKEIIAGLPAEQILGRMRSKMNRELLSSAILHQEYLFLRNGPYESMDRALFIKKSYWLDHPMKHELECVSISETTLHTLDPDSPAVNGFAESHPTHSPRPRPLRGPTHP